MSKVFRPWKTDEVWLLPPSVADFVPAPVIQRTWFATWSAMGAYTEVKG
jgi:hypothetical protein